MSNQDNGLSRNTIDKYYTKPSIAETYCDIIKEKLNIDEDNDLIIEPSAGNGSFISGIKKICNNHIFYDIMPDNEEIVKQDFLRLNFNISEISDFKDGIHLVGNPPFGRQSSLAIRFIKYGTLFCDSISFILPKSFKKDSLKNKIPLNFHCIYEEDVPHNSFLVNDVEYEVPCVFQIWVKKIEKRTLNKKIIPLGFKFVKKESSIKPDICFRRVGVYAGKVDKNIENKSIQSHNFIKFDENIFNEELYEALNKINYKESQDTVGAKSISKQEMIREFNKVITDLNIIH